MNRFLIFTWLLVDAVLVYGANGIRKCNTQEILSKNVCPSSTKCVENDADGSEGVCLCKSSGYVFNKEYNNDEDYCIVDTPQKTGDNHLNNNSSHKTNSRNREDAFLSGSSTERHEMKLKPLPRPHHIIAGILIPIVFVSIIIGGVFAYKKLHITQRIRNIRRTRRNRPFYEDVMLGTNDNDDPPLI